MESTLGEMTFTGQEQIFAAERITKMRIRKGKSKLLSVVKKIICCMVLNTLKISFCNRSISLVMLIKFLENIYINITHNGEISK